MRAELMLKIRRAPKLAFFSMPSNLKTCTEMTGHNGTDDGCTTGSLT